jgi:hypothetical protein
MCTSVLALLAGLFLGACGAGDTGSAASGGALFELPDELPVDIGSTEGPALFAGFSAVDFGPLWQGAVREVRFPLTSSGTEPVHIAGLKASCGCTLVSSAVIEAGGERALILGEPLAPGTRVLVTLRFDSRGREGREAKLVTVYSDAPGGRLQLEVGVETQPFLRADPDPLEFGRVFPSHELEVSTTITAPDDVVFGLELAGLAELPPGLRLALEPRGGGPRATAWDLHAWLAPGAAAGNLLSHVTLVSDLPFEHAGDLAALDLAPGVLGPDGEPRHYLDLWTTASVVGAVEISPPYLPFGFLAKGALTSASARIECFDPTRVEAFTAAAPTVRFLDADGAPLTGAAAKAFTPTLRAVRPDSVGSRPLSDGALAAWDLEVAALGFSGAGQNRLAGRVELDFPGEEIPDPSLDFQVILQP